jgi:hypothetical protein
MKEPHWEEPADDSKEFFDATAILLDDEAEDDEEPVKAVNSKSHITELRRRIEERLDSKRIDHEFEYEFEYENFDALLEIMSESS